MDDQIDPCHDFNKFACGGFQKNTIIPDHEAGWGSFSILSQKLSLDKKKLIEEKITDNDFESYKKAKRFFKSCMNEKKLTELGTQPLKKLLTKAGGWPVIEGNDWDGKHYDIWEQNVNLKHLGLSWHKFASIGVGMDMKNNSFRVLNFDSASLNLGRVIFAIFVLLY